MPAISHLLARDAASPPFAPAVSTLLIVLLALVVLGIVSIGALFLLRQIRRRRRLQQSQPSSEPAMTAPSAFMQRKPSHTRRNITAAPYGRHSPSISVAATTDENSAFLGEKSGSRPESPVPEIRITFPEEEGAKGGSGSRRSVVVTISDQGSVGLEPCRDEEPLPPYQRAEGRFQSLDMERMGGLREKGSEKQWA